MIGIIVADKIWPAKITRLSGLVYFIIPLRATGIKAVVICIRPYFSPVQEFILFVHRNTIRIPVTHDKNFRPRFICSLWEQIAGRNIVGAIRIYFYAEDFTPEVICIS